LLIAQLDNPDPIVRKNTSRLLHRGCTYCFKGGIELFLSKNFRVRDNLYDYLSSRLLSHPAVVSEFAEAVLGIKTAEPIRRMVPLVIPKLNQLHGFMPDWLMHTLLQSGRWLGTLLGSVTGMVKTSLLTRQPGTVSMWIFQLPVLEGVAA
jgi:hypothetical protein